MKQLKVGILGQGRSGYDIHAKWLRQDQERYKIVAIADAMPERTQECAAEFGATAFGDYRELLQADNLGIDLVINALPSDLHPRGTIDALEAGYNVVCEKPLARTVADFDRMVAKAGETGKKLLPFQNSRFQPAFRKIQSIIESGCLGRIIFARISYSGFGRRWDWQARREHWGGNLLNTGPHPVDQAVVLFGEEEPRVFARLVSDNPFGDAENHASVTLWGPGKPTIEVIISSFMAYPQGETYNIGGTYGGLSGNFNQLKWRYFDPANAPHRATKGVWSDNRGYCGEELDWREEIWNYNPKLDNFSMISKGFYDDAYAILTENAPRTITFDQVRRQIAVMEEAHRQNPDLV